MNRIQASLVSVVVLAGAVLTGVPWAGAASASAGLPSATGSPWPLPKSSGSPGGLAALGGGAQAKTQEQVASALARRSGRPVVVPGLTSQTETVTASPRGGLTVRDYVLPVRVRRGGGWTSVNTRLVRGGGGFTPAAVPGDRVVFSAGGGGPLAVVSAGRVRLALNWPGRLPAPVVNGSSATYPDVLPGIDLVLTATSAVAGGFTETLAVRDPAAARDRGLAGLAQQVSMAGARLRQAAGGGLAAAVTGSRSYLAVPEPRMWDSSAAAHGAAGVRAAVAAARAVGAGLAPAWSGPRSSAAGPGSGARITAAPAQLTTGGQRLRLGLDERMLDSASTHFPLYISPSFQWYPAVGSEQAFDPTQSETSCDGPHYNDTTNYPDSPVGYDDFNDGPCQQGSTDYSYYQVGIPSVLSGPGIHLHSASIQASEAYSSNCTNSATVTLTWTGTINKGTDWGNKPGATDENQVVTDDVGPDYYSSTQYSCGQQYVENDGVLTPAPFNVLPDVNYLVGKASTFTFRLWENGDTNENDHKQFTDNPDLEVTYAQAPSVPGALKATAVNDGTGSAGCDTGYAGSSSPLPPPMGKSASDNGPFLWATYNDPDGDTVASTIDYWQYSNSSNSGTVSAGSALSTGSTPVAAEMPASFTSGMANGTVIAWKAEATDGSYSSAWSPTCYFSVYPKDPDPPTVAAKFTQSSPQAMGTPISFTITQSGTDSDPAKEFVWGLDTPPPTSGTIPAAQTCTTTAATSSCTKISSKGVATLTVVVRSPGPHDLWVYELDTAGNESGMTNDAPEGSTSTFTGEGDTQVDYTSGASLSANFATALAADGNSLISNTSGTTCGAASGDGSGNDIDANDLTYAGWPAGQAVTVDGTSFTMPSFGKCAADNLLSSNQEIGTGSAGVQGSALVFLAASTNSYAQVPGLVTGQPGDAPVQDDFTAPAVAGGTAVTGSGCSGTVAFDTTQAGCVPASGLVNYAPGCQGEVDSPYTLTVPDWQSGPSDIAALTVPQIVGTGGVQSKTVKIYAFAVPVNPSCTISSVQLPDVGNAVSATVAGSGSTAVTQALPGLHIFGIAVRNTTTASPQVNGAFPASPAGQAWTGAFSSPVEDAFGPPAGTSWGNQTIRVAASPDITAPAGAQVRIRLSDPGFLSADGSGPLQVGAATIALSKAGAEPTQTPTTLYFGGQTSVTVPQGGDVYSDPLTLPFAVTVGQDVLVSVWLKNSYLPELPENSWASGAQTWFAPSTVPNETGDTTGTPFTGTGSSQAGATVLLTGIDVTTPEVTVGGIETSPGVPTVVVAGDNIIDGGTSQALSDALNAPSDRLAGQLASQSLATGYGVVDAGIEANQVLADGTASGGVSLLARLDRDILAQPDVGTVIIDEGLEDLLQDAAGTTSTPADLDADYVEYAIQTLENQLNAFYINVIVATLTPCAGYENATAGDSCTTSSSTSVDAARQDVNSVIDGTPIPYCDADFDAAVSNELPPEALQSIYNAGDDANLTLGGAGSGYGVLAQAVGLGGCTLLPSAPPLPAVP